jgi:hypothetical protein
VKGFVFFFRDGVWQTIGPGWLQTVILLICLLSSWDYRCGFLFFLSFFFF